MSPTVLDAQIVRQLAFAGALLVLVSGGLRVAWLFVVGYDRWRALIASGEPVLAGLERLALALLVYALAYAWLAGELERSAIAAVYAS